MEELKESQDHNDGTWSGLKKTIIGTLSTVIAGGGTWLGVAVFNGGHTESEQPKTEQVAPAAAPIINITNSNANQQQQSGGTNTIIKEKTIVTEKAAAPAKATKKSETEDSPW
jgi:hypothetical protein